MSTEQKRTLHPDDALFFEYIMLTDQIKPFVERFFAPCSCSPSVRLGTMIVVGASKPDGL